jgi:hypothetical protein
MFDIRKLLSRCSVAGHDTGPDTDLDPSSMSTDTMRREYEQLIRHQLGRWGITPACAQVEVRQLSGSTEGLRVFVGLVRLARWQRTSAPLVLLGLPLLEGKVRKAVRGTWLEHSSRFAGLWLHASEDLGSQDAGRELRRMLVRVAQDAPSGRLAQA